jgi:hypothetical protein
MFELYLISWCDTILLRNVSLNKSCWTAGGRRKPVADTGGHARLWGRCQQFQLLGPSPGIRGVTV